MNLSAPWNPSMETSSTLPVKIGAFHEMCKVQIDQLLLQLSENSNLIWHFYGHPKTLHSGYIIHSPNIHNSPSHSYRAMWKKCLTQGQNGTTRKERFSVVVFTTPGSLQVKASVRSTALRIAGPLCSSIWTGTRPLQACGHSPLAAAWLCRPTKL